LVKAQNLDDRICSNEVDSTYSDNEDDFTFASFQVLRSTLIDQFKDMDINKEEMNLFLSKFKLIYQDG